MPADVINIISYDRPSEEAPDLPACRGATIVAAYQQTGNNAANWIYRDRRCATLRTNLRDYVMVAKKTKLTTDSDDPENVEKASALLLCLFDGFTFEFAGELHDEFGNQSLWLKLFQVASRKLFGIDPHADAEELVEAQRAAPPPAKLRDAINAGMPSSTSPARRKRLGE